MTRFLFPRWTNKFLPLLGLFALAGGTYAGVVILGATDPVTLNTGYMPTQPVPYSHKLHAGELKIDCRYCHVNVQHGAQATIPPTATCINCHSPIGPDGAPALASVFPASPKLRAVHESWESGKSIPWVRIHRLPDFVFFNHSAHVNRGVSCVTCHGRVDTMEKIYQDKPLSMAWCIECHRHPEEHIRPVELITKLDWEPAEGEGTRAEIGAKLMDELGIHPKTNCAVCHR